MLSTGRKNTGRISILASSFPRKRRFAKATRVGHNESLRRSRGIQRESAALGEYLDGSSLKTMKSKVEGAESAARASFGEAQGEGGRHALHW